MRKHWLLASFALVLALLAGTTGSYLWYLNHQIGNIDRVDAGIKDSSPGQKDNDKPLNILLLGADTGDTQTESVADDMADGKWTPFEHRSDTLMIAHIPADRKSVQLVSIPRDTWAKIDGYPYSNGYGKINAAFAYGGPSLARQTVEQLTGIHIDHLAIIDWAGFKDLTTALGGIRVYIPETFYDDSQRITWETRLARLPGPGGTCLRAHPARARERRLRPDQAPAELHARHHGQAAVGRHHPQPDQAGQDRRRDHPLPHRRRHVEQRRDPRPRAVDAQHPHRRRVVPDRTPRLVRQEPGRTEHRPAGPGQEQGTLHRVSDDDIQRYLDKYPKSALGNQTSVN